MDPPEKKSTIRDWQKDDRPREKMIIKGRKVLSNAELIAILIGAGNTGESAVDLAKRILARVNGNLVELSKLEISDLTKFKGIGHAKAVAIVAALELGFRRNSSDVLIRKTIATSRSAFELFQGVMGYSKWEEFWVMLLNRANQVIELTQVSNGGVSGTVADPKKIYRLALEANASAIILGHNHPSGNLNPSDQDKKLTLKLKEAGNFMEITVLDHIIVGDNNYFSFADEGLL